MSSIGLALMLTAQGLDAASLTFPNSDPAKVRSLASELDVPEPERWVASAPIREHFGHNVGLNFYQVPKRTKLKALCRIVTTSVHPPRIIQRGEVDFPKENWRAGATAERYLATLSSTSPCQKLNPWHNFTAASEQEAFATVRSLASLEADHRAGRLDLRCGHSCVDTDAAFRSLLRFPIRAVPTHLCEPAPCIQVTFWPVGTQAGMRPLQGGCDWAMTVHGMVAKRRTVWFDCRPSFG